MNVLVGDGWGVPVMARPSSRGERCTQDAPVEKSTMSATSEWGKATGEKAENVISTRSRRLLPIGASAFADLRIVEPRGAPCRQLVEQGPGGCGTLLAPHNTFRRR